MTQMTAWSAERIGDPRAPLTDRWLADVGFKWHQMERQPSKHWVLWLGCAIADHNICTSDLGIELSGNGYVNGSPMGLDYEEYFCWLRSDSAHRPMTDLTAIVSGLTEAQRRMIIAGAVMAAIATVTFIGAGSW